MSKRFMTAAWRHLLMLNYVVDASLLEARVPRGLQLDLWRGQAFVSLVGFRFLNSRIQGFSIPWHQDFEEVNLRFYVVRPTPEGPRRGVVFLKEIVPRVAVALVARRCYNENYVAHPMRSQVQMPSRGETSGLVAYQWDAASQWNSIQAEFHGDSQPLTPGSEAEFIAEHYWGYGRARSGSTLEYQVEHPSWSVWKAHEPRLDCAVGAIYGAEFVEPLSRPPSSAFVADGSDVPVYAGQPLH